MVTLDNEGYQSVLNELDRICESFRMFDQVNFENIRDNIATVSTQSNSQKEMLERLREKIETLMEKNGNLEVENTHMKLIYSIQTVVIIDKDESGSSSGTEDGKGSGEESEEDIEEETIRPMSRKEARVLRQIENNVYIDNKAEEPQFKSRDFNTDNNLLLVDFSLHVCGNGLWELTLVCSPGFP
jgi:hypothetical protein